MNREKIVTAVTLAIAVALIAFGQVALGIAAIAAAFGAYYVMSRANA